MSVKVFSFKYSKLNFIHGNTKFSSNDLQIEFELYLLDILKNDIMISVNEYFDARVKSLGYTTTTGKSTVGVMEEGEYEFGTSTHETMIVIEGELITLLPGESRTYDATYNLADSKGEKPVVKVNAWNVGQVTLK